MKNNKMKKDLNMYELENVAGGISMRENPALKKTVSDIDLRKRYVKFSVPRISTADRPESVLMIKDSI